MKSTLVAATAFLMISSPVAFAQASCTFNLTGVPNVPPGSYSGPAGNVTVNGSAAQPVGLVQSGSEFRTGANSSVNIVVAGQTITLGAQSIACVTQTGPDICVQVGSSARFADCSSFAAANPPPAPPGGLNEALTFGLVTGGLLAPVLVENLGDDDTPPVSQ